MDRFRNTAQPDRDWWTALWPDPEGTLRALDIDDGTLADGVVYAGPFANDDVPLTARDAESGEELWRREAAVSARETVDSVRLAAAGDTLYVGDANSVRAFRP